MVPVQFCLRNWRLSGRHPTLPSCGPRHLWIKHQEDPRDHRYKGANYLIKQTIPVQGLIPAPPTYTCTSMTTRSGALTSRDLYDRGLCSISLLPDSDLSYPALGGARGMCRATVLRRLLQSDLIWMPRRPAYRPGSAGIRQVQVVAPLELLTKPATGARLRVP
jgi:hypothetical protein